MTHTIVLIALPEQRSCTCGVPGGIGGRGGKGRGCCCHAPPRERFDAACLRTVTTYVSSYVERRSRLPVCGRTNCGEAGRPLVGELARGRLIFGDSNSQANPPRCRGSKLGQPSLQTSCRAFEFKPASLSLQVTTDVKSTTIDSHSAADKSQLPNKRHNYIFFAVVLRGPKATYRDCWYIVLYLLELSAGMRTSPVLAQPWNYLVPGIVHLVDLLPGSYS